MALAVSDDFDIVDVAQWIPIPPADVVWFQRSRVDKDLVVSFVLYSKQTLRSLFSVRGMQTVKFV